MTRPNTSLVIHDRAALQTIAARRGYTQRRGVGTGTAGSISRMVNALAAGELLAIGPTDWQALAGALRHALAYPALTDAEHEALVALLAQIEARAQDPQDVPPQP